MLIVSIQTVLGICGNMVSKGDHASDTGSLVIFVLVLTISCFPSPKKCMNHSNEV